jgi:hypothetical protein
MNLKHEVGRVQDNRGKSRGVVAVNDYGSSTFFRSVRQCAKFLRRNPAAVTKVCQGAWNTCAGHKLYYEEDFKGNITRFVEDVDVMWD